MPQVPRYQPNQVQEQLTPVVQGNIRTNADTFGAGAGEAIGSVGTGLAGIVETIQKRSDDAVKKEGESLFSKLQIDTSTQLKLRKGKDAIDYEPVLKDTWDKGVEEAISQYDDENVKSSLKALADLRRQDLYKEANSHMIGEVQKYEADQHKSYLQANQNEAVYYYQDPEKVSLSIAKQKDAILNHAQNMGYSPEQTQLEMEEAESKTHLSVITRMINNGEDLPAKDYLSQYKQKLAGQDLVTAEKIFEEGRLRGESQRQSDKLVATTGSMTEALEKAREIDDPKLRDETVQRVKQRYAEKKQADNADNEELHRNALNIIDKTKSVDTIPREQWARFSASERKSLISYAEGNVNTSLPDYYDLMNLASTDKEAFNNTNLMRYADKLAPGDFKKMADLQAKMRKGKDAPEVDGYRTDTMIVNDSLRAAGFSPSPKNGSDDAKKVAQFRAQVDAQIRQHVERTGKKPTNEDVQAITDNLLVEVVTKPGFIFDTKKKVFELDPSESGVVKIGDVPRMERQKIEAALRSRNIPVTEEKVLELYSTKLQRTMRGGS